MFRASTGFGRAGFSLGHSSGQQDAPACPVPALRPACPVHSSEGSPAAWPMLRTAGGECESRRRPTWLFHVVFDLQALPQVVQKTQRREVPGVWPCLDVYVPRGGRCHPQASARTNRPCILFFGCHPVFSHDAPCNCSFSNYRPLYLKITSREKTVIFPFWLNRSPLFLYSCH